MTNRRQLSVLALAAFIGIALAQPAEEPEVPLDTGDAASDRAAVATPTTDIDDLSQAEIDAELARAEQILADPEAVEEFTGSDRLPADLPLALPSDF
jgi:hypothetical protein